MLRVLTITGMLLLILGSALAVSADKTQVYYYAMEQNGTVCGYSKVEITQTESDGRPAMLLTDDMSLEVTAMGKDIVGHYRFTYLIDPTTHNYFYHTSLIDQPPLRMEASMEVDGDSVRIFEKESGKIEAYHVPPGVLLQNTRFSPRAVQALVREGKETFACRVFSEADATVNDIVYTRVSVGDLEIMDTTYGALEIKMMNRTTGVQAHYFVDTADGLLLKGKFALRDVYLTDSSVVNRISSADLDRNLFARVGVAIQDYRNITYMKVKAKMQPGGVWLSADSLNVPGQTFVGTVEDNAIDGVFEISHERYDGTDAPPFPWDLSGNEALAKYMEPQDMIESDDEGLIAKAAEITAGAADAWDAARRISAWVDENISYDLPGGTTALRTYETRLGECGSHSNLVAAFCRASGIPARVVFGCMHVPNNGGSFGQHAWNEIYMGDAGWVPIDATAKEIGYVDCGHIRLGERISKAVLFNPDTLEILDYRVGDGAPASETAAETAALHAPYLGKYQGQGGILTVLTQNGALAVDIPGKMVFELTEPDADGNRYFTLTNTVCVTFQDGDDGAVNQMTIDSRQLLPRKADAAEAAVDVATPEAVRPLIGEYTVPMQSMAFVVSYVGDQLILTLPGDRNLTMVPTDSPDRWTAEVSELAQLGMTFDQDDAGKVSAMTLSQMALCRKMPADQ